MARTPAAARFHLELDGLPCGFLRSVEGGSVSAEVVAEPPGADHFLKKHLGSVAPEPIVLTCGLSLASVLYEWIAETWAGKSSARSGAIVFADAQLQRRRVLEFAGAVVSRVTIPAHDAGSKDVSFLTVAVQPETVSLQKASGPLKSAPAAKAKQWLASSFRVEIDGLETGGVARVEALTVETAAPDAVGERRVPKGDVKIDFPGVRLTVSDASADSWRDWHEDFVVKGNCDDAHERSGALVVLGPGLKQPLLRVDLEGLGIHRLAPRKAEAAESVLFLDAELYCERMAFSV